MKIQFHGDRCFSLQTKTNKNTFDANQAVIPDSDFQTISGEGVSEQDGLGKALDLPGEFEINGALMKGIYSNDKTNVIFKVVVDEIVVVHLGNLKEVPSTETLDAMGENVDVALIVLNDTINDKKAKDLIEKIEPRLALVGGDSAHYAKLTELMNAQTAEENPVTITKSGLSDDKTEVKLMNA